MSINEEKLTARIRGVVRRAAVAFAFLSLLSGGCKLTESPPQGSVRDGERDALAREGLAFARILTSPVQLPLTYAGLYSFYYEDGKPVRIGHTDPFSKGVCSLLHGSIAGPVCICEEICVGLAEVISAVQFSSVVYPWETYGFYGRSRNLKEELDYINSPEMMEKRRRAHDRLEAQAVKAATVAVEIAGEAAEVAIEQAVDQAIAKAVSGKSETGGGGAADRGSDARTGYAIIKGPGSIAKGKSARYQLCIGGKKVDCEWSGGTSITVSQSGRVLAGNPPIRSGKYRTTLKARYNGKEYSKSIYIVK